jgi:hypothetical protein
LGSHVAHEYYNSLDANINNINAQLHTKMNKVKNRLKDNWEYVYSDLSYREFKAQVDVFLKNKRHDLKFFIEASASRLYDYPIKH